MIFFPLVLLGEFFRPSLRKFYRNTDENFAEHSRETLCRSFELVSTCLSLLLTVQNAYWKPSPKSKSMVLPFFFPFFQGHDSLGTVANVLSDILLYIVCLFSCLTRVEEWMWPSLSTWIGSRHFIQPTWSLSWLRVSCRLSKVMKHQVLGCGCNMSVASAASASGLHYP